MAFPSKHELPKVNLSGLDPGGPGSEAWEAARAEVAWALANYGGLEAVYDRAQPDGLLGRVVSMVFTDGNLKSPSLSSYDSLLIHKSSDTDGKIKSPSLSSYDSLWIHRPSDTDGKLKSPSLSSHDSLWIHKSSLLLPLKSLRIVDPDSLAAVQECALTIWPLGNDLFCNTIWNYSKQMKVLTQMIHRMVLESLGLEDEYDSHMNSLAYSMRLSEYINDKPNQETKAGIPPHVDPNFVSIVWQQEEGLEVEISNGEWVHVTPMPNSFTVLLGEIFSAWTNEIFGARRHRVGMDGMEKRYSAVFNSFPSQAKDTVEIPGKLVDGKRPLLFKPFKFYDYLKFRHSDEGEKHRNILKAYCGLEQTKITV